MSKSIQSINRREEWRERAIPLEKHSLYRKIDRIMDDLSPGRILEVGCLDGRYLERLKERGWSVAGIDIQPQEADYIVEHDAAVEFPFVREFDVVLAAEVIEHLVDTDGFLRNCAAVLKPAGLLIVTTPNLLFGPNRLLMLAGREPLFAYADFHVRMFVWKDLQAKLERHFEIQSVRGSHVLAGMRHSRAFAVFSWLGDRYPKLSAHFIVSATPRPSTSDRRARDV
jgi:2-polyprenyl-3-methyl-5-hydroxy-6-metoxy-1,4-benzoquinol methylase